MRYITSIEQMALEKGKAKGRAEVKAEERQAIALKMLQEKMPIEVIARMPQFSIGQVQPLQL